MVKIGVLDIQGSVKEHLESLRRVATGPNLGEVIEPVLVKTIEQLRRVKGLIIPGGESTTIGKLLRRFGLREEIIKLAKNGKLAVWGTCAGAILLAKKIIGKQQADGLKLMDIVVERNAYGRQLDSFETQLEFGGGSKLTADGQEALGGGVDSVPAVFIRAPRIVSVGKNVKILAEYKGKVVAARQKNLLVTNFHPEMTDSLEVHKYFVKMCLGKN
ncbi:pyridoxal 5'-phosphate synthase glutaminase subunit PdxT [Candidatus Peregrinibacteria bacterium]|nr:pyridoxal 5'-phosphate synthase glutaminase subunit PdxT [Candidatus Peregrinibacteria bacterium]